MAEYINKNSLALGFNRVGAREGTGGEDKWYYCYICCNAGKALFHTWKDIWSSPHVKLICRRWSISQKKWVEVFFYNYLNGKNTDYVEFAINMPYTEDGRYMRQRYDGTDSIHFQFCINRIWGNDKNTSYGLYMAGAGDSQIYDASIKGTYLKGKKLTGPAGGSVFWDEGPDVIDNNLNPFDLDWGNITQARGQFIVGGDKYRVISDYIKAGN